MEIINNTLDFQLNRDTAVAMGKFDGLHIGHRKLLEHVLEQREWGLAPCVFTFYPSPAVLFGLSDGRELMTREEKWKAFDKLGVELLVEFPLTRESAAMMPEEFVREILVGRMRTRYVAAGEDVSFGRQGAGDAVLLRRLGERYGYAVNTIEKIKLHGREVSSTYVRGQVEAGRMKQVAELMGDFYTIEGEVCHGAGFGHDLGMPTANLLPSRTKLLPPFGVYFSRVRYKDRWFPAISNVGCKPTVTDAGQPGVETFLYDFDGQLYGEEIAVQLLLFHRPERHFPSVAALKGQLEADMEAGCEYWRSSNAAPDCTGDRSL
ncbi:MAG: riboflavin biosynthesis protein RibF [bacterium]|nr:riboflavin biosynthesis protein RibF [bacterium]MCM1374959.1 riboflavin biosynthesis protein RibF [Muribaculum sp.]